MEGIPSRAIRTRTSKGKGGVKHIWRVKRFIQRSDQKRFLPKNLSDFEKSGFSDENSGWGEGGQPHLGWSRKSDIIALLMHRRGNHHHAPVGDSSARISQTNVPEIAKAFLFRSSGALRNYNILILVLDAPKTSIRALCDDCKPVLS